MDVTHIEILPYSPLNATPSSSILLGEQPAPGKSYRDLVTNSGSQQWLVILNAFYERENDQAAPRFRIVPDGKEDEGGVVRCTDEDVIYALLHACFDAKIPVREVNYRGTVYTDVTDLRLLEQPYTRKWRKILPNGDEGSLEEHHFAYHTLQFCAKRDGRDVTVCFLGPVFRERPDYDSRSDGPDRYSCTRSDGVVALYDDMMYLGVYTGGHYFNGQMLTLNVHAFLERDGESFTISLLMNGRMCPKIRHSKGAIIYYYTPFDDLTDSDLKAKGSMEHLDAALRIRQKMGGLHPRDVIFAEQDGRYQYRRIPCDLPDEACERDRTAMKYTQVELTAAADLIPPDVPAWERLYQEPALAHSLLPTYLYSLNVALSRAEEYRHCGRVFTHAKDLGDGQELRPFNNPLQLFVHAIDGFSVTEQVHLWNCSVIPDGFDVPEIVNDLPRSFDDDLGADGLSFRVNALAFMDDGMSIGLVPDDRDLILEVFDHETNSSFRSSFNDLNKRGAFVDVELPKALRFSQRFARVLDNIGLYRDIMNAIIQYGTRQFFSDHLGKGTKNKAGKEMERRLYNDGEVPDPKVVSFATRMYNQFIRTGTVPNIALIGQAGTGKSTLAKNLGRAICGKNVMLRSASDLQSEYIGGTNRVVINLLIEAACQDEIIFIDEAYTLMDSKFGQEAVSILLPLMAGDRTGATVKYYEQGVGERVIEVDFKEGTVTTTTGGTEPTVKTIPKGVPPIWIAGYEDDIRLMLKRNQGLYRRFQRVALPTPDTTTLYNTLQKKLRKEWDALKSRNFAALELVDPNIDGQYLEVMRDKLGILIQQCYEYQETIKKFFRWGSQLQNSKYFANYAGVDAFIQHCLDEIDVDQGPDTIKNMIDGVIASTKRDIKHQLDTVRRNGSTAAEDQITMIEDNKASFRSLVGCDSQCEYMDSVIDMYVRRGVYERFGITIPRGVLMLGEPGTGKTSFARAVAGQLQERFERSEPDQRVGFMSLSAPEITAKPVSFIGQIFDKAEEYDTCVIFIDEVDAIAKERSQNEHYGHFIELIKQMDGIEQRSNILILAATNVPGALDPAFVRTGRIDKRLHFELPNFWSLKTLLRNSIIRRCEIVPGLQLREDGDHLVNERHEKGIEAISEAIAEKMTGMGYTAGDVDSLVNAAFLNFDSDEASRGWYDDRDFGSPELDYLRALLDEAVEVSLYGARRPLPDNEKFSVEKNDHSRSSCAVHEVGHALVCLLYGREPFKKITTIPRGRIGGYVSPVRTPMITKADYEDDIRISMGGKVAEEIVYGRDNVSVGASQDIVDATRVARKMVDQMGFSDGFEFMALQTGYGYSDAFRERCDREIAAILDRLYQETRGMLKGKKELIIALAEKVFDEMTMTGQEFEDAYHTIMKERG